MVPMKINEKNYYKLLGPRLTVCVSTIDNDGNSNIAPYSFATPLSFSPPLVGVGVGKGKDTLLNAKESQDFVLAPVTENWMKEGVDTEINLERGESEFKEIGLTEKDSEKVKSFSVQESPINIECKYYDDFETGDHHLLVGKIMNIDLKEGAVKNGRINIEKLGSIGHISGEEFCLSKEVTEIKRDK